MIDKCDFCASQNVPGWMYPCNDFTVNLELMDHNGTIKRIEWKSVDGWTACESCSAMIETEMYDLLAHATASVDMLVEPRYLLYLAFHSNRTGTRILK